MSYILSVLPVIPIAALIAAAIYAGIYNLLKKKREKPDKKTMFAEFVLVGWVVMFVYVTQIMSFGNGMGDRMNIVPLRQFVTAFRYGSNNAGGIEQFLLNIIMFVPLGFLLPVVFKKLRSWHAVLIVSLSFTVATELLQLISYRGTDIDDVIANTTGGLLGFALYLIVVGLIHIIRRIDIAVSGYRPKLSVGIILLVLVIGVFVSLNFCDGSSKYGNLYYGHLIPNEVEIKVDLDDTETERTVYKYAEKISLEDLQEKLKEITGFDGEWTENHSGDETYYSLFDGDNKVIFIHPYNKWGVYYEYGVDGKTVSEEIDEAAALQKAWEYLRKFGVEDTDVVCSSENGADYTEDNYYFDFIPTADDGMTKVYGDVLLELGKDGRLISVSDNRIICDYVENTKCISAADSIEVAQEVGCGDWQGKAVIESVEESYSFISETGYLIPTWQINGYLDDGSQTLKWHPQIDAVK
jgi:glycopeptide antibiotics resistance protein